MGPSPAMPATDLSAIMPSQLRPVTYQDFENAFCKIQPSISQKKSLICMLNGTKCLVAVSDNFFKNVMNVGVAHTHIKPAT